MHYKMKDEVIPYYIIAHEINTLKDTYTLCTGLLYTNPSIKNTNTCNFIYKKIETKTLEIKNNCPHIYFYTKYIK
ncbi:hypothetical protein [Halarcobacter sp.]|uniref:hypothetical protein n=1 Tax=Halarcobacter sp. TaxID=2321133 RepID=UPI0029F470AA|nr:hypothetical protein [Halarcobacter sp.]